VRDRAASASSANRGFSDGQRRDIGSVVWATGDRDDTMWVRIVDAVDASGSFVEMRGASPVPGLFFVGRLGR
jgi:putative flavoprotein involved in K+ transport